MINYQVNIVDNFFHNPDKIRKFALKQKYSKSKDGSWPGERTDFIHKIDPQFNDAIILKVLSSFVSLGKEISWKDSQISFQKITPFSDNPLDIKNSGWVHIDSEWAFAGLIYLTPGADLQSGTSIFQPKKEKEKIVKNKFIDGEYGDDIHKIKKQFYLNKLKDIKKYEKELLNNNNLFEETIKIDNVYNRMISYSGASYHKANNFYAGENERLTLVFFVNGITIKDDFSPINRLKDHFKY